MASNLKDDPTGSKTSDEGARKGTADAQPKGGQKSGSERSGSGQQGGQHPGGQSGQSGR